MIPYADVKAVLALPKHRLPYSHMAEYITLAACEGIEWSTLNCTAACPRHWPHGYVPRHRRSQ
jgi:hypothetical protein